MSARDEILDRVARALAGAPAPDGSVGEGAVRRTYRISSDLTEAARLDLLTERLLEYHASVRRCPEGRLELEVAAALAARGAVRIVVPAGLDVALPTGVTVVRDDGQLTPTELDAFDGVVTAAAVAIAETGTVVLDGSAGQGRRAVTLVPDYHLCIVTVDQVVALVPEAIARLHPERPLTWISGPSATSDIELDRVEGVHGPRSLEVVLVER